jgi:RNA polymerase sigma-70 factor (ECF subfamily)
MDDSEAIEKCRGGDKEAFRHLVEQYQRQAIGHATAILANQEDARDAVQEAFLDAFRALNSFEQSRRFYPWFYVLLRNRCFKLLAGAQRREHEEMEQAELLASESHLSREDQLSLETALRSLSADARELILLKHLDGLSYEELALRLEIPKGTVMSRLYHARKALAAKLTRKFHRAGEKN